MLIVAIYWKLLGNFPRVWGLRHALINADSVTRKIHSGT